MGGLDGWAQPRRFTMPAQTNVFPNSNNASSSKMVWLDKRPTLSKQTSNASHQPPYQSVQTMNSKNKLLFSRRPHHSCRRGLLPPSPPHPPRGHIPHLPLLGVIFSNVRASGLHPENDNAYLSSDTRLRPHYLTRALLGGGVWTPPLVVFREYLKNGGAERRRFWYTLSYINSTHVVKISDQGHSRSGHQVTWSDLTS